MSKATFLKVVKRISIVFASVIALLIVSILSIPYLFENEVNSKIKSLANEHINGELNYAKVRLTFFDQFPLLTASMDDVLLKGAEPFKNDTLLAAKQVSFGIDVMSLLKSKIIIDKFIVNQGRINILVDSIGHVNYNIYKSSATDSSTTKEDSETSALAFQLIKFEKTNLHYEDRSIPLQIEAKDLDYEGKGDLMSNIFDLNTRAKIASFSFSFDNELYVDKKSIDANLLTRINTNTLSFVFERNDIKINQLPVRFRGLLSFISHGYHLDFKLKSQESTLAELLSLVPNSYASWIKDLSVKGTSEVFVNLEGDYIVDNNKMPDLSLGLMVNNGYLAYKQSTNPLTDWNAKLRIDLPALNPDSLHIDLKQFDFKVASGYFNAQGNIAGLHPVTVHANIRSDLDLDKLYTSLQFPDFSFGGKWNLDAKIDGTYAKAIRKVGLQKREQEYIASIPTFNIKNTLVDGKFKLANLPQGLEKIAYQLEAKDPDGQLKSASISIHDISVQALNNYIKGFISITDFNKIAVHSDLKALVNLADIKNFYPIKQVEL
ncbi:AsmA family protein, partial [Sphingobacterium sp.]|uniref:AsmA family protein n=1 Tax=Sphingobacterium sp. TaxID=341027 RepID=UPI002897F0DD